MKENKTYDFFLQATKMALFILAALVVVFVMIRWGGWSDLRQTSSPNLPVAAKPTAVPAQAQAAFNLTGPFSCEGSLQTGSVSAIIQNHQVTVTISAGATAQHFLVKGDCAYYWEAKAKTGTKKCGIGNLISMADGLLSAGMPFKSLASGSSVVPSGLKGNDVLSLADSCKKQATVSASLFDLPKGVLFTEKKK